MQIGVSVGADTLNAATNQQWFEEGKAFLIREAELLDQGLYAQWMEELTEDIRYQIPIRVTRERHASSVFSDQSWHMNETIGSIRMRIERTYTDYNWAEDPPSRIRHFLTNFRWVESRERVGTGEVEATIKSNLLLFRSRFDSPSNDLISGERTDTLRRTAVGWKLTQRLVLLDHTTMGISSLGIFL
jgi:3-phenylpropionate/cinnamic acid dioxygenase small subunit